MNKKSIKNYNKRQLKINKIKTYNNIKQNENK
jgi:hypothetical protein